MSNIVLMDDDKPKVIGSGAIATADPPSASNLGALWVDGAVVWQSGFAGNFDNAGLTTAKDNVRTSHATFDANNDFDLEIVVDHFTSDTVSSTGVFCQSNDGGVGNRGLWIERSGTGYFIGFYNGTTSSGHNATIANMVTDGFVKLRLVQVNKICQIFRNDILVATIDNTSWTTVANRGITIGSQFGGSRCVKGVISKVYLQASVGGFCYDFSEGAGTTIFDKCGNGNNATLTDSSPTTFWTQVWKPL